MAESPPIQTALGADVALPVTGGTILRLRQRLASIRELVDEQAEDEGLWFRAETVTEAYLQQELRRLHAAVESVTDRRSLRDKRSDV